MWSETWLLSFHPDKYKILHIGNALRYNYVIRDGNTAHVLDHFKSEKDIGVTFDSALEFDIHINEKIQKSK